MFSCVLKAYLFIYLLTYLMSLNLIISWRSLFTTDIRNTGFMVNLQECHNFIEFLQNFATKLSLYSTFSQQCLSLVDQRTVNSSTTRDARIRKFIL